MADPALDLKAPAPFAGDDHARLVHPSDGRGVVIIAGNIGAWRERAYRIEDLPDACRSLQDAPHVYFSHQRFIARRCVAHLLQLGCCYQDLDYHDTSTYKRFPPEIVAMEVLHRLDAAGIPDPWILASGRGLLLLWPHNAIPRAALSRWRKVQETLTKALHGFGVDGAAASDASRVFRIAGSRNPKQWRPERQVVRLIRRPSQERWDFDDLADTVLPYSRAEVKAFHVERANRRANGDAVAPPRGFTAGTLWEARLTDLQRLRHLRWWGELPPGQRDLWLFLACTSMSWLAPSRAWDREFFALAREAADWSESETRQRMSAVLKRAEMAARGQKIEWNGVEVDPRYRFKTDTILNWLEISDQEVREAGLQTLVPEHVRRERDRERKQQERRAAGAQDRQTYLQSVQQRRQAVLDLRAKGHTHKAIAAELGISESLSRSIVAGRR